MKRNVVQQGSTSLLVSLPIKWARLYDIKKGDELELTEQNNSLLISTTNTVKETSTEISLLDSDKVYVWRILSQKYISGYDEIKILFNDSKCLNTIDEVVREYMISFEIVKQEKSYCIIKNISKETKENFDPILRRIFLNLKQSFEIMNNYFSNKEDLSLILNLERTNNRHTYYLRRLLNRGNYENTNKIGFMFTMIFLLEQLANEFKFMTWYLQNNPRKSIDPILIKSFERINSSFSNIYNLHYKFSNEQVLKIIKEDIRVENILKDISKNPELISHFSNIIKHIRNICFQSIGINS